MVMFFCMKKDYMVNHPKGQIGRDLNDVRTEGGGECPNFAEPINKLQLREGRVQKSRFQIFVDVI